jgi:hypothetical protein
MTKYVVIYQAEISVEADTEEQALDYAIDEWGANPDGVWTVEKVAK